MSHAARYFFKEVATIAQERAHRLNGEITVPEVRLNGINNEQLGVVRTADALRMAEEADVDLVEIAPTAVPPVCRLMDYGKFKYREQKKEAEARKKRNNVLRRDA